MQVGSPPNPASGEAQGQSRAPGHLVYEALYSAILERRLAPATRLSKETLGRIFRVSTGTVQRALTRLADEGAVELAPNQVAAIARPCERNARELLEARLMIEAQVIRLIGDRLDAQHLAELRAMVERQRHCLAVGDHAGLLGQANRFHLRLAEHAGNPWLQSFLAKLLPRAALSIALSRGRAYTEASCDEHQALLDALEAGDPELAGELLSRHLHGLFARLRFTPPPTEDLRAAFQGRLEQPRR
ncbi:GntR family transcriptional regulator [Metapseudomonas resinovorans]|uniref:Putative GntR family transcriptional regulator n=1 Tax=Metapseudomonas resinovorans NBRC 106553 TaxID=1245471 RepID=S6AFG8_METRE|nr:GntR family transcriptional regulator [Pseudomonas resinovorans]BAN46510.1 putative GntR family transcriptional regulator [Pseudomonas resinovorans NBRC 106553]